MRVLHIGKFWPPYAGGIEQAARDLCCALAGQGVDVTALVHATPRRWRSFEQLDEGVDVRLAACLGQLAYAPTSTAFPLLLHRVLAAQRPDVLHLHMPNPAAFWALLSPAARRIPWLVHWHADIPLEAASGAVRALYPAWAQFEKRLLRHAARIVCTSPDYRDASRVLRPWRDKTRVIPLGIGAPPAVAANAVQQARCMWPGQGLRLLAVGRLSHYKGYDVLLRALADAPDVQLLLIGDGECRGRLRKLVSELGLGERIRLAGRQADAERDAAYAAAELFCLPSVARSEAFGVVLLEAMRARLPIVASRVPGSGMLHVLDHGQAGELVQPGDPGMLADRLQQLARDPARRDRLAAAGQQRWQRAFTLDGSAERVRALYEELAK